MATSRATQTARKRVQFSVLGVATAIALLLIVTGVGIGLATGTTVYDDDIDYWIVPESDGQHSPLINTDNPQFSSVHSTNERIRGFEGVDSTTPVVTQVLRVQSADANEHLLIIGIINSPNVEDVFGLNTAGITVDDPYYGDGGYNGSWTGDVVLSEGAATILDTSEGEQITISGGERFTVRSIEQREATGGELPVAIVQLSELQTLTGADTHDQADEFVVQTTTPGVESQLEEVYPQSEVLTRGELTASQTINSDLPLALAITAFVVAVTIGTLFVATSMGLEIAADKQQLATLSAIGLSTRSQLTLIGVQTLVTTTVGGLVGSLLGLVGIWAINVGAMRTITSDVIAVSHPLFILYGVGVALLIGLFSLPYLLMLTKQMTGGVPE
ncbi:FtsX-like permease family protein [Natrialbaceae archaeon A-gly3]